MMRCAQDLGVIDEAGANRKILLNLLARAVIKPKERSLADRIRLKQRQLRTVAKRVRTVTTDAERLAKDNYSYLQFYSPFASKDFERHKLEETARLASRWPFEAMRRYAGWAEKEANAFGLLLRRNAQKENNLGVLFLLFWVYSQTGKLFENQLARLLTDASEVAGQGHTFSPSKLRKMFQRHV
jgi:hypothetical protein